MIDDSISFPSDYIDFIETYGSGHTAEFITIFNVFSKNENINFFSQKKTILETLTSLIEYDENYYNYTLYPNENGLLPIGITDNGDYIFWVTTPKASSDSWDIAVIASRSPDVEHIKGGIVLFLESILSKKIKCSSFPTSFPTEPIKFISI